MADHDPTRWTVIRGAAEGRSIDRHEFALRYESSVRAYLGARWRGSRLIDRLEDAAQETFVTLFSPGGPLQRADPAWPGGFRPYLYGVIRNVARGFERGFVRDHGAEAEVTLDRFEADEESLARTFDREWARTALRQAALLQEERARKLDERARRRVEILRLRFQEGLPIREIAAQWDADPAHIHHEYARARREFKQALRDTLRVNPRESPERLDEECIRLLELLG